ncbi:class I SAM-dependent methyltransferase [Pseudonocardia sp. HH130629-09]|uniref:class I SAM-dependent methyltransferase n=1 Tax=Pseudonocardia sp. HH130629-09 TaxID=1641402 RepID=UPI0039C93935
MVFSALHPADRNALDVGCGEGGLARELRRRLPSVTGIDSDVESVELAIAQDTVGDIDFRCGDFMTADLEPASFDLVSCVATLHHLDGAAALQRMRALVRPGGRLVVVGLAQAKIPADLGWELLGSISHRWHTRKQRAWEHPSPVIWPPPMTFREMRTLTDEMLPGRRFRRHVLWRFSVVWTRQLESF